MDVIILQTLEFGGVVYSRINAKNLMENS